MWFRPPYGKGPDVESGARPLYPVMLESPQIPSKCCSQSPWPPSSCSSDRSRTSSANLLLLGIFTVSISGEIKTIVTSVSLLLLPLGRISLTIYGGLAAIIFCGYIIYDTDNQIKRYSYDEYVWAAVTLYLDIINLFLSVLTLFRASET